MGKTYRSKGHCLFTHSQPKVKRQLAIMKRKQVQKAYRQVVSDYESDGDLSYNNKTTRVSFSFPYKCPSKCKNLYSVGSCGPTKMEVTYNIPFHCNSLTRVIDNYTMEFSDVWANAQCNDPGYCSYVWKEVWPTMKYLFTWERHEPSTIKLFERYLNHPMLKQLRRRKRIGIFKPHLRQKTHETNEMNETNNL